MSAAIHELAHALSAACISAGISSSVELLKHSAAEPQARSAPVPAAPAEDELPPAIPDTALPSDDQLPAIPDDQPPAIPDDQPPAIPDDLPPAIPDDLPPADLPPAIPSEPVPSDEPAAAQKAPDAVAPAQAFVREGSKKVPPPVAPKPRLSRGSSQEALPLPSTSNPSAQSAPLTAVSEAQEAKPAAVTPAAVESSGVVMRVKPDRDRARDLAVRSSLADSGLNSVAKDVDTKPKTIERFTIEMPQLRKVSGAVKTGARPPGSDLAVLKEPVVVEPVKRSETAVAALKASGTDVKPPSTPEWRRKLRATQQASATPSGSSAFPVVQRVRPVSIATDSVIGEAPRAPDWKRKLSKTTPVDAKPAEVKPVEVKPAEANPVEVKPVEAKPVEAKPVEVKPVEVKAVEVKPVEGKTQVEDTDVLRTAKPSESQDVVPRTPVAEFKPVIFSRSVSSVSLDHGLTPVMRSAPVVARPTTPEAVRRAREINNKKNRTSAVYSRPSDDQLTESSLESSLSASTEVRRSTTTTEFTPSTRSSSSEHVQTPAATQRPVLSRTPSQTTAPTSTSAPTSTFTSPATYSYLARATANQSARPNSIVRVPTLNAPPASAPRPASGMNAVQIPVNDTPTSPDWKRRAREQRAKNAARLEGMVEEPATPAQSRAPAPSVEATPSSVDGVVLRRPRADKIPSVADRIKRFSTLT
eukprot:m.504524 g.504524  ORF g.504524 m.504524 type:complete len:698 (+) comp57355_c0_seq6:248-2341(+)